MKFTVTDRFLKYVQIDTQANPYSETVPSTEKQKNLSKVLSEELTEMGITHELTDHGYIYAHIPPNTSKQSVPKIFFCSHLDTAFDCSGTNVKPIVHQNYQGGSIVLPDDTTQVITEDKFPELKNKIGHDLITASGLTLLGADDKSGVASIMDALYQIVNDKNRVHGGVSAYFTTDEEIGRGVKFVELEKLNADFGYTMDSGEVGNFEFENFSANGAKLIIKGVSAHPGYAKGKMEHAVKIVSEIIAALPKDKYTPETTSGKEGFIHPTKIEGALEQASAEFLIRSFETSELEVFEKMIMDTAEVVLKNYPGSSYTFESKAQYRNMRDVIEKHSHIIDLAVDAMKNIDIIPNVNEIRGGTDGAVLSHKGMPCPNIFSGQHGIHSKLEWTTSQDMQRSVDTILEIIRLAEERG